MATGKTAREVGALGDRTCWSMVLVHSLKGERKGEDKHGSERRPIFMLIHEKKYILDFIAENQLKFEEKMRRRDEQSSGKEEEEKLVEMG